MFTIFPPYVIIILHGESYYFDRLFYIHTYACAGSIILWRKFERCERRSDVVLIVSTLKFKQYTYCSIVAARGVQSSKFVAYFDGERPVASIVYCEDFSCLHL